MTQIRNLVEYLQARLDITSERGATAVEYGLLVGLIALAIIVAVGALGGTLDTVFSDVDNDINGNLP